VASSTYRKYKKAKSEGARVKDVFEPWEHGEKLRESDVYIGYPESEHVSKSGHVRIGQSDDLVTKEELAFLENEWLDSQGRERKRIHEFLSDKHGKRKPLERFEGFLRDDMKKYYTREEGGTKADRSKTGKLEIRRASEDTDTFKKLETQNPDLYKLYMMKISFMNYTTGPGGVRMTEKDWEEEQEAGFPNFDGGLIDMKFAKQIHEQSGGKFKYKKTDNDKAFDAMTKATDGY